MCIRPGSRKPHVLPLPVLAMATRSRPAMATGHACAWIAVGALKPARLICRTQVAKMMCQLLSCEVCMCHAIVCHQLQNAAELQMHPVQAWYKAHLAFGCTHAAHASACCAAAARSPSQLMLLLHQTHLIQQV
jgi:hypothetical protein